MGRWCLIKFKVRSTIHTTVETNHREVSFSSDLHKYDCDRSSSATINYTYLCSLFDKHQKGARVRIMWKNIMIRYMVIESYSDTIKQNFICSLFFFFFWTLVLSSLIKFVFSCLFLSSPVLKAHKLPLIFIVKMQHLNQNHFSGTKCSNVSSAPKY